MFPCSEQILPCYKSKFSSRRNNHEKKRKNAKMVVSTLRMRGKYYIWTSGSSEKDYRVHLWIAGDERLMTESSWAEQFREYQILGASLPEKILDELVVMR